MRPIILKMHRWLGLLAGVVLAILGVTGTLIVYHDEIDQFSNCELFFVEGEGQYLAAETIVDRAVAHFDGSVAQGIAFPSREGLAAIVYVAAEDAPSDAWEEVFIDPWRGTVLGSRTINDHWIFTAYDIHYSFLIGRPGEILGETAAGLSPQLSSSWG